VKKRVEEQNTQLVKLSEKYSWIEVFKQFLVDTAQEKTLCIDLTEIHLANLKAIHLWKLYNNRQLT